MANYESKSRSNYFRVNDRAAFVAWCEELGLEVIERDDHAELVGFMLESGESGLPTTRYDEETEADEEYDFWDELAQHIAPGDVAIVQTIGWENMRYLVGEAAIITHTGFQQFFSLDTLVMAQARSINPHVTDCIY